MQRPYLTLTLEVSGPDEDKLLACHDILQQLLRTWAPYVEYGNVQLAYQDQGQMERDAEVDGEEHLEDDSYA